MKRRDFNKILASIPAIMYLPKLGYSKPEDYQAWFNKNYHWLAKWLNNVRIVNDIGGMQIIRHETNEKPDGIFIQRHRDDVLFNAVFSTRNENKDFSAMDGFCAQTGRLPKQNDKVRFECLNKRWFAKYQYIRNSYCVSDITNIIVSECRLKIL